MLNTIIIEDERPAMENLLRVLSEVENDIQVSAVLSTVKESIQYLASEPEADIIFSDVQLSDGSSFDIFRTRPAHVPVVFITGYDDYMMNAFACNGIDYLLKPVDKKEMQHALLKYRMLEKHFAGHNHALNNLIGQLHNRKKSRLVVRRGLEHIALKLEDVVLLYTENKLVYVIDRFGKKYIGDKNLGEMEEQLDENMFFRANRQYIINIEYIRGFKPYEKVKLLVDMSLPELRHPIIISQENAPQFREWMFNA